jgi:two-component system nitrogen regulation sensor histidine kinase NtrY
MQALPQRRLRTKVTAFFLLAAAPVVLLSTVGVVALDRVLAQEILQRQTDTAAEARRIIDDERARVESALKRVSADDQLDRLGIPQDEADREDFEKIAGSLAARYGLDLLAFAALAGPFDGELLANAHLPASSSDDTPTYAALLATAKKPGVGLVHERVDGNPPRLVPALVTGRLIHRAGKPAFIIYGGVRLDGHRLTHVARAGHATLILRSSGLQPAAFPSDAARPDGGRRPHTVKIAALPKGRSAVDTGYTGSSQRRTRLDIYVHTQRLERTRVLIRSGAGLLGGAALLAALLAGAFLSRRLTTPIVELAEAAGKVSGGDLTVQLHTDSKDEVGSLVVAFNHMTQELTLSRKHLARAERVAAWQQIARRVAHEIKNPLFPIQMSIETLRKSYAKQHPKFDEIMQESTSTVLDEVKALNRIVTEFSDFARLPTPNKALQSPKALLERSYALYRHGAETEATVRFDDAQCAELSAVLVDPEQLGRALINLVKNAMEAAGPGGEVSLRAYAGAIAAREGVWLEVQDNGPGMPQAEQKEVFTPYFTTKANGTGLGLAIVDRIVSEHDGEVQFVSEPGQGTRVRIWLPSA